MYEMHKFKAGSPISFFEYKLKKGKGIIPHWHENIEIIYITNGALTACINNEKIYVTCGDVLIANSNVMHHYLSDSNLTSYYCLIVSIDFLNQFGLNFSNYNIKNCLVDNNIRLLFTQMWELAQSGVDYCESELCADALKIASILMRKHRENNSSPIIVNKKNAKIENVKKAIIYMKKNFDKKITLEDICSYIGVSKCYFCHTFKDITGITAIKMLNYIKCKEAKRILLHSGSSVKEAAYRCGFENLSYFTKIYKEIMGQLPSQIKEDNM